MSFLCLKLLYLFRKFVNKHMQRDKMLKTNFRKNYQLLRASSAELGFISLYKLLQFNYKPFSYAALQTVVDPG